jgi:hypothetical protein
MFAPMSFSPQSASSLTSPGYGASIPPTTYSPSPFNFSPVAHQQFYSPTPPPASLPYLNGQTNGHHNASSDYKNNLANYPKPNYNPVPYSAHSNSASFPATATNGFNPNVQQTPSKPIKADTQAPQQQTPQYQHPPQKQQQQQQQQQPQLPQPPQQQQQQQQQHPPQPAALPTVKQ